MAIMKRSALIAAACMMSISAHAIADNLNRLNLPAGELIDALKALARQADVEVVYTPDQVRNIHTQGLRGTYSPRDAIDLLLKGTPLQVHMDSTGAMVIALPTTELPGNSVSTSGSRGGSESSAGGSGERLRLAQPDQGVSAETAPVADNSEKGSAEGPAKLEEVIVTAQKREERLKDVPVSLVAVGQDELQQRHITNLLDLPQVVPDVAFTNTGNNHYFEIRGVSNSTGNASLIGLYIDEADVTLGGSVVTQIDPSAYDLERVEVLRGPQGTLYGEGSAGGTIRFITRKPSLTRFGFDSDVTALFTDSGAPGERINAVVNVPLVQDQLGLRVVGTFDREGGWIDQPAADLKDINGRDLTNVRVKGLWQPNTQLSVSAMAIINRSSGSTDYSDVNAPQSYTQLFHLTTTPRIRNDYDLYNLTLTYDLPSARILGTTSYLKDAAPVWNSGVIQPLQPPGQPDSEPNYYFAHQDTVDRLSTAELRLSSLGASAWQWTIGTFYRHYRDSSAVPLAYFGQPDPVGTQLPSPYALSVEGLYKSWSAFCDTSYRLWSRFTLGAGVRYFRDHQDLTNFEQIANFAVSTRQTAHYQSVDPRVYAKFELTDETNLYASAAKGFRSGGINQVGQPPFGPENVWTYELGLKTAPFAGRVTLNTAIFWSNYTDYQTYGFAAGSDSIVSYILDAGKARIKGVESDLAWQVFDRWRLDVRGSYLNTRFTQVNAAAATYAVGDSLDEVPRYQFTTSAQRDFTWNGKRGLMRLDYSQQGPETARNRYAAGPAAGPTPWYHGESDTIRLLSFTTNLFWSDNLRVGFFAQNLLNDQGFVNPLSFLGNGVRSRPRTFGIEFGVTLE